MKTIAFTAAIWIMPSMALAQTPNMPSLWNCVAATKVECVLGACRVSVPSTTEFDLINWSYARCSEGCFGGQSNHWSERDGELTVTSLSLSQLAVIRSDNSFTDIAVVHGVTYVSEGTCKADYRNGDAESSANLIDSWLAFDAWQKAESAGD